MSFTHRGRTLNKVAVIGSGQIGPDIALYFAKVLAPAGVQTVVVDVAQAALDHGKTKLAKKVGKGVEAGAFTAEQQAEMMSLLTFTTDYGAIAGADLIVEAATENRELKAKIFAQVEALVAKDALLTSNSSHLEPEVIFANLTDKSRSAVIHYFFPAERNLVVEIVPGSETSNETVDWLLSFYEAIGKVPVQVRSRYGYALDPVFEGLFLASLLLADRKVATIKQIDTVATRALGMTVGSFTAMNLTGGNPLTAVGLDEYTSQIDGWFHTPKSLAEKVKTGESWDTPKRGEVIDVPPALEAKITEWLRGAYFGIVGEIVDAGLISVADFDMALELALDMKPAFRFMNEMGTTEAFRLVRSFSDQNPGYQVSKSLMELAETNQPWDISVIQRTDRDGVAVLTIRRPKVLNALNQDVFDELRKKAAELEADRSVKAVVLTGFGRKAFVSGADVNFLARIETSEQGERTSADSNAAVSSIEKLAATKPVVCAFNGLAFGGGLELAMACTARIARAGLSPLAAQPETNLGIIPGAGGTQRLPRIVGLEAAAALLRTGKPINSAEALRIGLISEEVEGDLVERAVALAQDLARGSVIAKPLQKGALEGVPAELPAVDIGHRSRKIDAILCAAILDGARTTLEHGLKLEAKAFGAVCGTQDMRIGVENFLKNGPRAKAEFKHA